MNIPEVTSTHECDALLAGEFAIFFKHSLTCPVSHFAHREVMRFRQAQPDAPVYLVPVQQRREVARYLSQRTGVRHESPQILVLRRGEVMAAVSHNEITAELLHAVAA